MKCHGMEKIYGCLLKKVLKDSKAKNFSRDVMLEYQRIVEQASDIGYKNLLLSSYLLAAFFIAMNRKTGLSPEDNLQILENGIYSHKKFLKMMLGDEKSYFSEKKMAQRRLWSEETYQKKHKNDWLVDVLEKNDDYDFGLNYRECGVCKLCEDEGCPQYAKYLCRLDFILVEVMGIHLKRTMTLAEGNQLCDFRFSK